MWKSSFLGCSAFDNLQALQKSPGITGGFDTFSYCHALNEKQLSKDFI